MSTTSPSPVRGTRFWWGIFFIYLSLFAISMDSTIMNVALPSFSRQLGASTSQLQWIVGGYVLAMASLLLTTGTLGDRYGRKRILQLGLGILGIGSVLAVISPSVDILIIARVILGIGAAMILPSTLSLLTAQFPRGRARSRAIGIWSAVYWVGAGVGPIIGGALLTVSDWRGVFLINIPVVGIALLGNLLIQESREDNAPQVDVTGAVLAALGLIALVYALKEVGVYGWSSPQVIIGLAVAAISLVLFGWWQGRARYPLIPLYLFRNPSFYVASIAEMVAYFALIGTFFGIGQYVQTVRGYSEIDSGVVLLVPSFISILGAVVAPLATARLGLRWTVAIGTALIAFGLLIAAQTLASSGEYLRIIFDLSVMSFGIGMSSAGAVDSVMGSVPLNRLSVGSAINDTARELGGALGVAILGTILIAAYNGQIEPLGSLVALPESEITAIQHSIEGAHILADNLDTSPLAQTVRYTANTAFTEGISTAFGIGGMVTLVSAIFVALLLPTRPTRSSDIHPEKSAQPGRKRAENKLGYDG